MTARAGPIISCRNDGSARTNKRRHHVKKKTQKRRRLESTTNRNPRESRTRIGTNNPLKDNPLEKSEQSTEPPDTILNSHPSIKRNQTAEFYSMFTQTETSVSGRPRGRPQHKRYLQ